MTTLSELKAKWFIDVSDNTTFPPRNRHIGSRVRPSTDGNTVTAVRDGERYMRRWAEAVTAMGSGASPAQCQLWITGWRLEGVETLGHDHPESDALDMMHAAYVAGVTVRGLISEHALGLFFNGATLAWLRNKAMWGIVMDGRYPSRGSGHQKFTCLCDPSHRQSLLGSIDISKSRWDTSFHDFHSLQRNPWYGKPTHDTGLQVEGPAVADIEATFQERWDDSTRDAALTSLSSLPPPLGRRADQASTGGTHSVQVLHTYGCATIQDAYSWSPQGEFTVWASYLNALKRAERYIYIEDQYFMPSGWPAVFDAGAANPNAHARECDLFYQLGDAIRRGVKVLALVPSNAEDRVHAYQKFQRDVGVKYLAACASDSSAGGEFAIASLTNGTSDIYVHSKLMIVDDELVLCGSANFVRRSMTCDSELQVAIVDSAENFAIDFRTELWVEHLGAKADEVADWQVGYKKFKAASLADGRVGHVRRYPYEEPCDPSFKHAYFINQVIDPYKGPPL